MIIKHIASKIFTKGTMNIITYLTLILSTISNALTLSLCRLNNPVYHTFETAQFALYILFGVMVAFQVYPLNLKSRLRLAKDWLILFLMVRFSLYSATWGYVAYKNPLYLGDGAWTDRAIKTVLFDWMNQGLGALGYLYFIVGLASVLMVLGLIYNDRERIRK